MECSCIKGNYDFILQSKDCSRLTYQDISDWMIEDYYAIPDTYTVNILIPGRKEGLDVAVNTNGVTVLTPEDLGLKSKCIVDGVYCFTIDNCGTVYKKSVAVTYQVQCCLDNLVVKSSTKRDLETIQQLQMMLDGVHINAKFGNIIDAHKQLAFIQTSLESLDCNCL